MYGRSMSIESDRAFTAVSDALLSDPDDDVQVDGGQLSVKRTGVARLEGDELLVEPPTAPRAHLA